MLYLCLLLPEVMLLKASFYQSPKNLLLLLLVTGTAISLVWFRPARGCRKKNALPKGLVPALLLLAMLALAAALILSGLAAGIWRSLSPSSYGRTAFWTLLLAGTSAAILGGWGLVKARISDRRWRSLYILGLTVLAECVLILSVCVSINLDACSPHWWTSFAVDCSILGLIGLAGGGEALC